MNLWVERVPRNSLLEHRQSFVQLLKGSVRSYQQDPRLQLVGILLDQCLQWRGRRQHGARFACYFPFACTDKGPQGPGNDVVRTYRQDLSGDRHDLRERILAAHQTRFELPEVANRKFDLRLHEVRIDEQCTFQQVFGRGQPGIGECGSLFARLQIQVVGIRVGGLYACQLLTSSPQ